MGPRASRPLFLKKDAGGTPAVPAFMLEAGMLGGVHLPRH